MTFRLHRTTSFSKTAGPRLRCFLAWSQSWCKGAQRETMLVNKSKLVFELWFIAISALLMTSVASFAQVVCVGTSAECKASQEQLCREEPAPANLSIAHQVRLSGILLDPTGAPVSFDAVSPDHYSIVQIRDVKFGKVLFAVPLRSNGEFEFESVPAGEYRLIIVWMNNGEFRRLPLADQPKALICADPKVCKVSATIRFHGTDNPIDACPPK